MLKDIIIFVAGLVLGGFFVFRGMRAAMVKELSKPPLTGQEKDERARKLVQAVQARIHHDRDVALTLPNDEPFDPSKAAKAVRNFLEISQADSQRLVAVLKEVADRIGEAPIIYNENGFFMHPEMAPELDKPGNEALREMLIMMAHMKTQQPD
jgi:hypothetical protein